MSVEKTNHTRVKIGDVIRYALRKNKVNQEIVDLVKKRFPDSKVSLSSVNWYRGDLQRKGEKIPHNRDLVSAKKGPKLKKVKATAAKPKAAKPKTAAKPKATKPKATKPKATKKEESAF